LAVYSGDTDFQASQSASVDMVVTQDTTTTSLSVGPASSITGQAVTFTAAVSPDHAFSGAPSGSVTFYVTVNGSNVALGTVGLSSDSTATFASSWKSTGHHLVVAVYSGATAFTSSPSATLDTAVNRDMSSVALGASVPFAAPGQSVTFTAVV